MRGRSQPRRWSVAQPPGRLRICYFGYPDVFEDFYPHYEITQRAFATDWEGTGSHAFVKLLQQHVGDVVWVELSLAPELREGRNGPTGARVRFASSSWLHRTLWRAFYLPKQAWRSIRFLLGPRFSQGPNAHQTLITSPALAECPPPSPGP